MPRTVLSLAGLPTSFEYLSTAALLPDEAANLPILVRSSGSWCELGLFFPNSTSTFLFASRTSAALFDLRLLPVWIGQVRLVLFGRHGEPLMQHFYSNGVTIVTQQNDSALIS